MKNNWPIAHDLIFYQNSLEFLSKIISQYVEIAWNKQFSVCIAYHLYKAVIKNVIRFYLFSTVSNFS